MSRKRAPNRVGLRHIGDLLPKLLVDLETRDRGWSESRELDGEPAGIHRAAGLREATSGSAGAAIPVVLSSDVQAGNQATFAFYQSVD